MRCYNLLWNWYLKKPVFGCLNANFRYLKFCHIAYMKFYNARVKFIIFASKNNMGDEICPWKPFLRVLFFCLSSHIILLSKIVHVLQFITLYIIAKVYLNQKNFTLEEVNWNLRIVNHFSVKILITNNLYQELDCGGRAVSLWSFRHAQGRGFKPRRRIFFVFLI